MTTKPVAMRHESAFPVLTRPGYAAPSVIVASADLADVGLSVNFAVRVMSGGSFRVIRLTVQPTMGATAAITSRALRSIRLDHLAREAVRELEQPVSMREDYAPGAFQFAADVADPWASHGSMRDIQNPQDQVWVSRPVPGRRFSSREQAERAAKIYAEAVESGSRAPTQAVAAQLGYSRSQVSRMLRTARDLGLLGHTTTPTEAASTEAAPTQQASPVKPDPAEPSIFLDPSKPHPWEGNQ